MTITEFLTARYDEEEEIARSALHTSESEWSWASVDFNSSVAEDHGRRWSPARVLADIAAKRAIVERAVNWRRTASSDEDPLVDDNQRAYLEGAADSFEDAVSVLAQPYASHADYDPAWRP